MTSLGTNAPNVNFVQHLLNKNAESFNCPFLLRVKLGSVTFRNEQSIIGPNSSK